MKTKSKFIYIALAAMLALGAFGLQQALAVTPGMYLVDGNSTSCANLYQATIISGPTDHTGLSELGPLFGLKYDNNPTGDLTHAFTTEEPDWVLTGGAPPDPSNSVSIFNVLLNGGEGVQFDWSSTLGLDAVIVKAKDGNAYVYSPEVFGDVGLMAPEGKSISHIEFCYDYELTATKTANAQYTRTYTWDITKDFDGEYSKFIGDTATTHDYKVSVDQTVVDSAWAVSGEIVVSNLTPFTVGFSVSDLVGGTPVSVSCLTYELAPAASTTCTYSAALGGAVDGTNVATITSTNPFVKGAVATADYTFGAPTTVVGFPEVNVTDTNGGAWEASGDAYWEYTRDFACPTDQSLYVSGKYVVPDHVNTAEITETGQSDTATVKVTCYAPTVSKTADATWKRSVHWTLDKAVTPEFATRFIGESAEFDYTVTVKKYESDEFWVTGKITLSNPTGAPRAITIDVEDALGPDTPAVVNCGDDKTFVTLDPGETKDCAYGGELEYKEDGTNTATAKFNDIDFPASAGYAFGDPVYQEGSEPESITVDDTLAGDLGSFSATGDAQYTLTQDCSADPGDYTGDGIWTKDYPNTATIVETTGDSDSEDVTLTCYAPVLDKDAAASWEKKYDWEITKDPNGTYTGFIGDKTFSHGYQVEVDQTVTDQNFMVSGKIFVSNPAGSPGSMTVDLVDRLDALTSATVDCGGGATSVTVAPGATESCDYSGYLSAKTDGINTATGTFKTYDFTATKAYAFGEPEIIGYPEITVTDSFEGSLGTASGDQTFDTYFKSFKCPVDEDDYTDGVYVMPQFVNTAKILQTGQSDSATVDLTCYAPVVSKDAAAVYYKTIDWTITKDVTPASAVKFIGEKADFDYTVTLTKEETFGPYVVSGKIHVKNPAPMAMTLSSVIDMVAMGVDAVVDCGDDLVVPAGETKVCTYTANLDANTDGTNRALVSFNGIPFEATAAYAFGAPLLSAASEPEKITADDTLKGDLGEFSASGKAEYQLTQECSADLGDYANDGMWTKDYPNTAMINETSGDSDSEKVTLTCYAPVVKKTAAATYDETHTWEIEKSVSPENQSGYPGDTLGWTWTVNVSETLAESNFKVAGKIMVRNFHPTLPITVDVLSDVLNDGTVASVDCDPAAPGNQTSLTIPAGWVKECSYVALPEGRTATLNTAAVKFNDIEFTAQKSFAFAVNVINGSAMVTDTEIGLNELLTAGDGPWEFSKGYSHTCEGSRDAYFKDGVYTPITDTIVNWAYVKDGEKDFDKDDATTTWTCEAGFADLLKLTDGAVDPTQTWSFALYNGPDGFGTTPIGTGSTLGDVDGVLDFGGPALRPDKTYTICELGVPAGWSSQWLIDGNITVPYNPNADDDPPEDLGNRCVDFTATKGTTVHFQVDNRAPGGDPRTPGYWKNWNTCTGGNQQFVAAANGGWEEGFWLLDDVLNPAIGGGIVWDDILVDGILFPITKCEDAVNLLDKRDLNGVKKASDPFFNLATHLLAAQLNFGAGACVTPDVLAKALEAETLLDSVNFNGLTYTKQDKKSTAAVTANNLATYLDNYNNGMYCGSLMP